MRKNLGRGLVPVSTLAFGALLVTTVVSIALFAFGAYVTHVRHDAATLLREAAEVARAPASRSNARESARQIAARLVQPALLVVFTDRASRVTVLRADRGVESTRTAILVRDAGDRREPVAGGLVARLTLGLATAFGLQTLRTNAGGLNINVDTNQPLFVADVRSFLPAVAIAFLLAIVIAAAATRVLTRAALRPLTEVTRALERFSAGDFTPTQIDTDGSASMNALAVAYNAAAEQVERAFAERARANVLMRQFMADGGHQLRTPLTVIRGFVSILRSQRTKMTGPEMERVLESMGQQTTLMSSLIDKLMLLEQWEYESSAAEHVIDVADLAREVVAPFALAHPERFARIDADANALANLDRGAVGQALSNVVDNALKYAVGEIEVSVRAQRSLVEVIVVDAGPGMPAELAARAFDRFSRGGRRDVEGSGLGLAIAKRAVERSRGRVRLESDVRRGTCVAFAFPQYLPRPAALQ